MRSEFPGRRINRHQERQRSQASLEDMFEREWKLQGRILHCSDSWERREAGSGVEWQVTAKTLEQSGSEGISPGRREGWKGISL